MVLYKDQKFTPFKRTEKKKNRNIDELISGRAMSEEGEFLFSGEQVDKELRDYEEAKN